MPRITRRHFLQLAGSGLLVALYVPGINIVFQLMGSTCSAFVCFILPAACWLKLEGGTIFEWETLSDGKKFGTICLFIFGVFTMFSSTSLTIMKKIEGN